MKKALMLASVASMIDKFNMENIKILQNMGYDVEVAANFEFGSITSQEHVDKFKASLKKAGITVYDIPIPRHITDISNMMKSYKIVKELCRNNKYEIMHCHSPIGGVIARLACRKYRKTGTKIIYTAHGFHFFKGAPLKNWLMFYPIEKYFSKYTDCLITINEEDYNLAQKKMKAKQICYVPGVGVDTEKIKLEKSDSNYIRSSLGLNDNDFLLFSVGQISKRKNHENVIRALRQISDKNIKYIICGFGELESNLKSLVDKLNIKDRVKFIGFRDDVYKLLKTMDLFVFPSLQEGLPVALMEAMAAGLPCVVSNIRGNRDLIDNGKGGYLRLPSDINGFAEAIEKLYNDAALRNKMGKYNREKIKQFDCSVINKMMMEIYSSMAVVQEGNI